MSIGGRKIPGRIVAALALLFMVVALLPVLSKSNTREVVLVARGMAFYLESDPLTPNPTIEVKAGEQVRVVLRNEDRGFTHDVAVPSLDLASSSIDWNEATEVTLTAPRTPGELQYECRPHRLMMKGILRVVP